MSVFDRPEGRRRWGNSNRYAHLKRLWIEDMVGLVFCGFGVEGVEKRLGEIELTHISSWVEALLPEALKALEGGVVAKLEYLGGRVGAFTN